MHRDAPRRGIGAQEAPQSWGFSRLQNRNAIASGNYGTFVIQSLIGPPANVGMPTVATQEYLLKLGKAVAFVAAGDGNVTPTERAALLDLARTYGASAATLEELRTFDARSAKLETVVTPELRPVARLILHDAIGVARVDGFGAKEREAAFQTARQLGVPTGVVTAIEGIFNVADAVRGARLTVIGQPPVPTGANMVESGAGVREREFGVGSAPGARDRDGSEGRERSGSAGPIPKELGVKIGKAILVIAGADGDLSEPELGWFLGMAYAMGAPNEVIEEYAKFDYHSASLTEFLGASTKPFARLILHDAIRVARQDGFGDRERMAAVRAAGLLGLDTSIVTAIEGFLLLEDAVRAARMRVLSPS